MAFEIPIGPGNSGEGNNDCCVGCGRSAGPEITFTGVDCASRCCPCPPTGKVVFTFLGPDCVAGEEIILDPLPNFSQSQGITPNYGGDASTGYYNTGQLCQDIYDEWNNHDIAVGNGCDYDIYGLASGASGSHDEPWNWRSTRQAGIYEKWAGSALLCTSGSRSGEAWSGALCCCGGDCKSYGTGDQIAVGDYPYNLNCYKLVVTPYDYYDLNGDGDPDSPCSYGIQRGPSNPNPPPPLYLPTEVTGITMSTSDSAPTSGNCGTGVSEWIMYFEFDIGSLWACDCCQYDDTQTPYTTGTPSLGSGCVTEYIE